MKMRHILRPVTNAQNRQSAVELFKIKSRWIFLPYRIRTTRKDYTFYTAVNFGEMIKGVDLAVNVELPDTARNELGELRAKVKNEDRILISDFGFSISDFLK
jgi:hypothetical protein